MPRARFTLTQLDLRAVPAVLAVYTVTQDWGSGFQAQVKLTNDGTAAVPFGTLEFTLPSAVTSVWDAKLTDPVGDRYAVTNAGWNPSIPAGGSVSFGFVATRGTSTAAGGFVLNGVALDGTSPPAVPPTVPPPPPVVVPPTVPPVSGDSRVTYRTVSDWGTGQTGELVVRNTGTTAVTNWRAAFDLPGTVSSIWNGSVTNRVGNRYTVGPAEWNRTIPAGGSVTVGFNATPGGIAATNFVFTADVVAVSPPPVVPPAVPPTSPPTVPPTVPPVVVAPLPTAAKAWPAKVFAPYVDATLWPTFDFVAVAKTTAVKHFTLAFVTADPQNRPAWGGYAEYAVTGTEFDATMRKNVAAVRDLGGDVAVSFGGAAGRELAEAITDVPTLTAAYRSVVAAYGLTHIDFDIEGAATADKASVDRRSQAIAALQTEAAAAKRELHVRFTLPVLPTGLTADGLNVLQSAKKFGARVDVVNIMAMDYGDSAAPNPAGKMGDYAIQAGESLFAQLGTLYPTATAAQRWKMVGITPMIGRNDVLTEVFDQQEAKELLAWAQAKGIGLLAMWSLNRDRQNAAGALGQVDLQSSSILQTPLEFSKLFAPFTG